MGKLVCYMCPMITDHLSWYGTVLFLSTGYFKTLLEFFIQHSSHKSNKKVSFHAVNYRLVFSRFFDIRGNLGNVIFPLVHWLKKPTILAYVNYSSLLVMTSSSLISCFVQVINIYIYINIYIISHKVVWRSNVSSFFLIKWFND